MKNQNILENDIFFETSLRKVTLLTKKLDFTSVQNFLLLSWPTSLTSVISRGSLKLQSLKLQGLKLQSLKLQSFKLQSFKLQRLKLQSLRLQS